MTANCKRVSSRDNLASNGVIHIVEEVLQPVTKSLMDIISSNPQLSYLKTGKVYYCASPRLFTHYAHRFVKNEI